MGYGCGRGIVRGRVAGDCGEVWLGIEGGEVWLAGLFGVVLVCGRFDLGPLDLPLDRAKRQCPKALPDPQF